MKTTVNLDTFRIAFDRMGRSNQFSYVGQRVLFAYLDDYEDSTGEELELDVIALCCDFSEEHYKDIADNYSIDLSDAEGDVEEELNIVKEYLAEHTQLVGESNDYMLVYQAF